MNSSSDETVPESTPPDVVRAPVPDIYGLGEVIEPSYVVGIGASAGGLEALERFFRATPVDTGMAFIVIQHLSPDFRSMMDELLARFTTMKLVRVEGPQRIEADTIYLMPPRKDMVIENGLLVLLDRSPDQQLHMPINRFFTSLARAKQERAVAIILSGTGSDGSLGIADVHDNGGLILVQSETSAKFDGMPRNAITTGYADAVGAPEELPGLLLKHAQDPSLPLPRPPGSKPRDAMGVIMDQLLEGYGIDFSQYKPATILRRIDRRIAMAQSPNIDAYCQKLVNSSDELDSLYRDLLIGVTRFFRDPEAFEILKEKVFPSLISALGAEEELRIWVPGCATGEEAYTMAMLALREFAQQKKEPYLKIFATDVHRDSLRIAAAGVYPAESLELVPRDLRDEFFIAEEMDRYRVTARLRKALLFSAQNLIKDVPFNRVDMVSCRNLLIYFQPSAQARALASFHFALKLNGVLFLGPSETTGNLEQDFETIDRQWRIYRKTAEHRVPLEFRRQVSKATPIDTRQHSTHDARMARIFDRLLVDFMPPSLLVNDKREILHLFGSAAEFLTLPSGRMNQDVVAMCEGELRMAVPSAIQSCMRKGEKVVLHNIRCQTRSGPKVVDLVATPTTDKHTSYTLTLLQFVNSDRVSPPAAEKPLVLEDEVKDRINYLEVELQTTKESLQTVVEEMETTNEELQASNEELLASNEELQSTNEELHSVNEELYTVNAEHELKIRELDRITNDLRNLMRAADIGVVFLDATNCVRMFTPRAAQLFNLLPQDIGRDLRHITLRCSNDHLMKDIDEVLRTRKSIEQEIQGSEGERFLQSISPYIDDSGNQIGTVITYVDITTITSLQQELKLQKAALDEHAIVSITNAKGEMTYVNRKFCDVSKYARDELVGQNPRILESAHHPRQFFGDLWKTILSGKVWHGEILNRAKDGSRFWVATTVVPFMGPGGRPYQFVSIQTDISERKRVEEELQASRDELRLGFEHAPIGLALISPGGHWLNANPAFVEMLGYSLEQLKTMVYDDIIHPEDLDISRSNTAKLVRGSIPVVQAEKRYRRSDGSYIWCRLNKVVIPASNGRPLRIICQIEDIHGAKLAAEEKRLMEGRLAETAKLESLGVLAGGIAHDFNNLLTGILGNTQIAEIALPEDHEARKALHAASLACMRASDLCRQMLAYAGKSDYHMIPYGLNALVTETTELIHASIGKRVKIDFDLNSELPPVDIDPSQIRQVIMNLVINASDAIGSTEGVIKVKTSLEKVDDAQMAQMVLKFQPMPGSYVCLEVSDNGCGINVTDIRRIFEPFFTTKFIGRGLGLSAVHGIVRIHNGLLGISTKPRQGTTFRLYLRPSLNPHRIVAPTSIDTTITSHGTGGVLVVDDEPIVLESTCRLLELAGFKSIAASAGSEALEILKKPENAIDLVLLDLSMPGMTGDEIFKHMRTIRPDIKVVLTSGYPEKQATSYFGSVKPNGFIKKPTLASELITKIKSVIGDVEA